MRMTMPTRTKALPTRRAALSPAPTVRVTGPMLDLMARIVTWAKGRPVAVYMPYADEARTMDALQRRGLVEYHTVPANQYNGYALTPAGEALRPKFLPAEPTK